MAVPSLVRVFLAYGHRLHKLSSRGAAKVAARGNHKEQMLIRRDVPKDEQPPAAAPFDRPEAAPPIAAHTRPDIVELIPPTPWLGGPLPRAEWIEIGPQRAEAYLQWRTLMDALAD